MKKDELRQKGVWIGNALLKKFWRTMKLTGLFMLISFIAISAGTYSQTTQFSFNIENGTLNELFLYIEQNSEFRFAYNKSDLDDTQRISFKFEKESVEQILNKVLDTEKLSISVKNDYIIITQKENFTGNHFYYNQTVQTVTGKVTDSSGAPLPGVTIVVKGTTQGIVTDDDGNYSLANVTSNATLVFSFVGMKSQEIHIAGQTQINLVMQDDTEEIDEVVVTALGVLSKKRSLSYSTRNFSGESLSSGRETNIVNALSGKVAGIVITPSSSGMGGSSRLIIRGNSSISGNNQPLYVVDGIPISNEGFGTASGDISSITSPKTDYGSGISDINPNDIASISVLKGPNAAALYGSNAANGVILITTKKGMIRKGLGVSYSTSVMAGVVNENTLPSFQNEYGQGNGGIFLNSAHEDWGPKFDGRAYQTIKGVDKTYTAQPDNVKDFFNTEIERTQTVEIEGGNENANVRFSYTNFNGKGITPNSELNKNTFNLRANLKLSKKLSFDTKITFFTQKASNRVIMGWGPSVTNNLYNWGRSYETEDFKDYGDENSGDLHPYATGVGIGNPYWTQFKNTNDDFRNRVLGFAKANYQFNDNLSVFARIGTDVLAQRIQQIMPYGTLERLMGERSDSNNAQSTSNADVLLMFNKELTNSLNLNVNAGGNYKFGSSSSLSMSGHDFKIPTNIMYNNLKFVYNDESFSRSSTYSAYISGSLDYKEMVYLNFSGRNDWQSSMWTSSGSPGDWSYFYPSLSFSFIGNDILGINENSFLSFSKLRFSWAEVGSGSTKTDQIYYYLGSNGYHDLLTVSKSNIFNDPDLKPESTRSIELGLELKFLKNRLYSDFTYYEARTFDQILNVPVDASTGFAFKRTNVGEISNKGFELLVGGTPIKSRKFYWDSSINISKNTNVLESFIEGSDSYLFTNHGLLSVKTKVGGEIGDIYGRDFVYQDGKMVVNADGFPISSPEKLIGNYQPDMTGGFFNTFGYKNLELAFLIDFRLGGEAYSQTTRELAESGHIKESLEGRDGMVLDAVVNTGTEEAPSYVPNTVEINAETYWSWMSNIETPHMKDLTNVRLREVTLSYSFPRKWFANIFINKASFSLVGRNLFFLYKNIDGVDPETSMSMSNFGQGVFYYDMPTTRKIGFNLNISF